jgi:hypothetical protein
MRQKTFTDNKGNVKIVPAILEVQYLEADGG